MGKPCCCTQFIKSWIFTTSHTSVHIRYCKPREKPVSVLQVTWESVSGTASHARCSWTCNEIEGSHDKIIITIVSSYTGKNITHLLPLIGIVNTDGNKLMIYSGIGLYCGVFAKRLSARLLILQCVFLVGGVWCHASGMQFVTLQKCN